MLVFHLFVCFLCLTTLICALSVGGARYKAHTTAGCSCRMDTVANGNGTAVCRHNFIPYEGSITKCEKLTCWLQTTQVNNTSKITSCKIISSQTLVSTCKPTQHYNPEHQDIEHSQLSEVCLIHKTFWE